MGEIVLNEKRISCIRTIQTKYFIFSYFSYLIVGAGKTLYRLKIEKNQETDQRKLTVAESIMAQWPIDCLDCFPVSGGELVAIGCRRESISLYKFSSSSKKLTLLAIDRQSRLPSSVKIIDESFIIGGDKFGTIFGLEFIQKNPSSENSLECCLSFKTQDPIVELFLGDFTHYFKMTKSIESLFATSTNDEDSDLISLESFQMNESVTEFSIYALGLTGTVFELRRITSPLYQKLQRMEDLLRKHLNLKKSMHDSVVDTEVLKEFSSLESVHQSALVSEWNQKNQFQDQNTRNAILTVDSVICYLEMLTAQ